MEGSILTFFQWILSSNLINAINVCLMLAQRLRRWLNIKPTLLFVLAVVVFRHHVCLVRSFHVSLAVNHDCEDVIIKLRRHHKNVPHVTENMDLPRWTAVRRGCGGTSIMCSYDGYKDVTVNTNRLYNIDTLLERPTQTIFYNIYTMLDRHKPF